MAFQKDSERIFSGGINLLPPGDLVPPGECVAATNWRADQQGLLRARRRETAVLSGYTAPITTCWIKNHPTSSDRYVGDADSLWLATVKITNGFSGKKLGLVAYQDQVWIMNQAKQGRAAGTVFKSWGPPVPLTAPTLTAAAPAGVGRTGSYNYYVTYFTAENFEGDVSPTASITITAQDVNLTVIPVSPDATVTGRYIYRAGGTQVQLLRVGTINDNVTTTFTDSMTDLAAEQLGISQTLDHDPPPAAKGLIGPYFDRLIAYNSAAYPNRFWWTEQNKPSYFPGSNANEGNWAPVGDDGEEILHVTQRPGMIIFYKTRSIWRCVGDPGTDGIIEPLAVTVGMMGDGGIAEAGTSDYIDTQGGIYECNGDRVKKISGKLDPIFQRDALETPGVDVPGVSLVQSVRALSVMAHRQGRLWFSYAADPATTPTMTLVYDIALNQWTSDSRGFTALFDEGQPNSLVGAIAGDNHVYAIDNQQTGAMSVNLQTRYLDQGRPNNPKTYADLVVVHNLLGDTLTVQATYDYGLTGVAVETLGTITSTNRAETVLTFNGGEGREAKNIGIRIYGTVADEARIFSAYLHYQVEQRDGRTFDTSGIDLGISHVKEVSGIALDLQATGPVTWTLYADMPSGSLDAVKTGIIPFTSQTRYGVQLACDLAGDTLPEGKLFRLVLTSATTFRVYDLRFLLRRLGVYLVAGQGYHTRELPLAHSRVGLVKKLEVDARTDGNMVVTISTNLPGTEMAARKVQTITSHARRWTEIRLPVNTRGRHLRVDLDPDAPARLYSARVWVKQIGDAGSSLWDWLSIPIEPSEEEFQWVSVGVDQKP